MNRRASRHVEAKPLVQRAEARPSVQRAEAEPSVQRAEAKRFVRRARAERLVRRAGALVAAAALTWPFIGTGAARADEVRDLQGPAFAAMDVPAAWKITRGAGVTVGVVDSGVQTGQPELAGQVTAGPNMIANVDGRTTPARLHGTSMSMLIAGKGRGPGGADGVIGVAPQAKLLVVRAIAEEEDPSFRTYKTTTMGDGAPARGIRYVVDHGVDVINLSIGEGVEEPEERAAVAYAVSKGVVVVAAAGNDGDKRDKFDSKGYGPYSYPGSYPGVITVAATTPRHTRAGFSNRNFSVLVAAPGVNLPGIGAEHGAYYITDGTSDSTALVSGIAALIRARHPKLPPALVAQALVASTPSGGTSYDPSVGHGEVNAAKALAASDKLAAIPKGLNGKPGDSRFGTGGEPGPVTVVPRPTWAKVVIAIVILGAIAGAAAATAIAITLARRHPATDVPPPAAPPLWTTPPPRP
ncbi:S8 family serine peptidase [Actinomadura rupiterrae]|uniref:S8 family serine peptidase n=1 Tax=Actinomadura rupiterrae TaxID=559627 RepID=UPI0020A260B0|nr:S8 family serine peptidase [Actinomadura rupiterrae]MCP2336476.1 subtilisin family serine protease [Actinomadura rupiterrae]